MIFSYCHAFTIPRALFEQQRSLWRADFVVDAQHPKRKADPDMHSPKRLKTTDDMDL